MSSNTNSSDNAVEAANLGKVYRNFWGKVKARAVNNVDLTVKSGQVFGLLGPNGAGKSTIVKMLLGLIFPTRGSLRILGESPRSVSVKTRIGYLPEESYFYHYLTAQETIEFFGALFGMAPAERRKRAEQLMDMLGITHVKHRQVGEFSKGMMRRVGLAQALINDPELVILDEPTSGLDPIGCREVKDIIQLMAQRGKTVILSSHLLADVEDVCDEIVVLYGGKIHAQGQVKELLKVQQKTRLEFPAVDEHVQNALLDVLKTHVSENEIALEKPHMRLEEFFLQVVEKAQSEKVETYGVQQPGAIADYLKGEPESDEQRILGALSESMSGEHAESKSDTAEEPEEEQAESTHVEEQLAALTGEKKSESDKNEPSEEQAEKDPEDKLRGIMDQQNHR